ncbi:MAG: fasciclin domain-containing protein [Acidimicrobiales bacterium]
MQSTKFKVFALTIAIGLTAVACGDDGGSNSAPAATTPAVTTPAVTTTAATSAATKDIVDTAVGAGKFTVLAEALTKADLVTTLKGTGPFTVFAPTDDAFAAALKSLNITKDQLFADKAKLSSILTYHVVAGKVPAAEVVKLDGKSAKSVNGASVAIALKGSDVYLNGDTKVVQADIAASNGIIHVIDKVLLQPAM